MVKDSIVVDMETLRCSVAKPCDEKYARKLLQDYLKENTGYKGGWSVTKILGAGTTRSGGTSLYTTHSLAYHITK